MSFSADWLALREPYDTRARNRSVLAAVAGSAAAKNALRIVDLACGTGSTMRAVATKIPVPQNWALIDNNLSLLARASEMKAPAGVTFSTIPIDIGYDLEAALDGPVDLVTTSALLDLVSEAWLERLVTEIVARQIPIYAALSYDGRVEMNPPHPHDGPIVEAMNAHQRGDKGFGPALGPGAASSAMVRFQSLGYSVVHGSADWLFNPADREVQTEIFSGWVSAAREIGHVPLASIVEWLTFRCDAIAAGGSSLRVGHMDFFAAPIASR